MTEDPGAPEVQSLPDDLHQNSSVPLPVDLALGREFVGMYVSDDTFDMGQPGRRALPLLFERGAVMGSIPRTGQ